METSHSHSRRKASSPKSLQQSQSFSMRSLTTPAGSKGLSLSLVNASGERSSGVSVSASPSPSTKNVGVGSNLGIGKAAGPSRSSSSSPRNISPSLGSGSHVECRDLILPEHLQPHIKNLKVGIPSSSPKSGRNGPTPTASKIVSQNVNGTLALTGIPRTESELQLFRVLQRANLLSYFDVMIELGGDDVQQLCEAGEEEFLEIMALIGMASKPLHVRRLQKALQEWMTNPALFQTPVLPPGVGVPLPGTGRPSTNTNVLTPSPPSVQAQAHQLAIATTRTSPLPQTHPISLPIRPIPYPGSAAAAIAAVAQHHAPLMFSHSHNHNNHNHAAPEKANGRLHISTGINGVHAHVSGPASASNSSNSPNGTSSRANNVSPNQAIPYLNGLHHQHQHHHQHHLPRPSEGNVRIPVDQIIPPHFLEQRIRTVSEPNSPATPDPNSDTGSSHSPVPFLQENELLKIAEAAAQIVKTLPPYVFEPQAPSKRKFSGDFELIMRLSPTDPRRSEEIRKMSTIYGRPDPHCSTHPNKRKFPKPLTMHEVCVNEAAGQLCKHVPALLTYRDELCALAKQVVRDAGLPYSSHQTSHSYILNNNSANYSNQNRRNSGIEISYGSHNGSGESHGSSGAIKRMRVDGSLEVQDYSGPPSNQSDASSTQESHENGLQITPIRNLSRRSPPSGQRSPLPLEIVTVTSNSPKGSVSSESSSRRSSREDEVPHRISPGGTKTLSVPVTGGSICISHDARIVASSGLPKPCTIKVEHSP